MKAGIGAAALVALGALLAAERRWPLRPRPGRGDRLRANAAFGLLAAVTSALAEAPLVALATRAVEQRRWGLTRLRSGWKRTLLGVLWLDYTLYLWHRAAHVQPLLWRLHLPHHLDPALDATTAWRFHVLELLASAPVRALQILLLGVPAQVVARWQRLLIASISLHHSNLRLPEALDRALALVIVTPRLHGTHHSANAQQRNSNWSSGLTLWDRLHGTHRPAPVAGVSIGVQGESPAPDFRAALFAPFVRPRSLT